MKKSFLNFIQFSELWGQTNNKKVLYINTFLKAVIIVTLFGVFFIQEAPTAERQLFFIFDFGILCISMLLGMILTSSKFSLSNTVAVFYAVIVRIWVMVGLLYIIIDTLMRILLNSRATLSVEHIETHLLFGVLMLVLVPMAFLMIDKNIRVS